MTYRNMYGVIAEQVKSLKIMHERRKDENDSLLSNLRDIQSESHDKAKYGKLYYVVMLSRWQEAAVNRKYDAKLRECEGLKGELLDAKPMLENKERDHHSAEADAARTKQQMRKV